MKTKEANPKKKTCACGAFKYDPDKIARGARCPVCERKIKA